MLHNLSDNMHGNKLRQTISESQDDELTKIIVIAIVPRIFIVYLGNTKDSLQLCVFNWLQYLVYS